MEVRYVRVTPPPELLLPCDVLSFGDRSPKDIIMAYEAALSGCNLDKEAIRIIYVQDGESRGAVPTK